MIDHEFELPEGTEDLKGSMQDGVQLPFDACYFYVKNGSPRAAGGIESTGGWCVDAEEAQRILQQDVDAMSHYELRNSEGGTYQVYGVRQLAIAPIAKRERWTTNDKGQTRSHLQVIALVAIPSGNGLSVLGPHVLSAKGYQTKYLKESLSAWEKQAGNVLGNSGAQPKMFWHVVGTYGEPPEFIQVGSAQTSPITPVRLERKDVTMDVLKKRYVGKENVEQMVDILHKSAEWLAEWDKRNESTTIQVEDEFPLDPIAPDDDIPW